MGTKRVRGQATRLAMAALLVGAGAGLLGCELHLSHNEKVFRILSYNVQNLFDAETDGTEYEEFQSPEWTAEHYRTKVGNIASVLRRLGGEGEEWPDVIALQEIENEAVLERLQHEIGARRYRHRAIGCDLGSATHVGVLLRKEPEWVRCHGSYHKDYPYRRATLEIGVAAGSSIIQLFVVHWKSKLGGAEETEPARRLDAGLIAAATEAAGDGAGSAAGGNRSGASRGGIPSEGPDLTLVAGDVNERCDEWSVQGGDYETALRAARGAWVRLSGEPIAAMAGAAGGGGGGGTAPEVRFHCPWLTPRTGLSGSYFHDGAFQAIDQILISKIDESPVFDLDFEVLTVPDILKRDGTPYPYRSYRNDGYSDHLPISMTVYLEEE